MTQRTQAQNKSSKKRTARSESAAKPAGREARARSAAASPKAGVRRRETTASKRAPQPASAARAKPARAKSPTAKQGTRVTSREPAVAPTPRGRQRSERGPAAFFAAHAGPLGLLGLGTGWLLVALTRGRTQATSQKALGSLRAIESQLASRAGDLRQQLSEGAAQLGDKAAHLRGQATQLGDELGHKVEELGQRTSAGVEQAGRSVITLGKEHPLTTGLLALGAGLAAAALLPSTRRENAWMGGTRDRLLERAQASATELKERVMHGAEELRDSISQLIEAAE